ncbi:MAG: ComF family protein [Candidatus Omnitrophota bacterium]
MLPGLLKGLGDLVFPHHCFLCRRHIPYASPSSSLCLSCQSSIKKNIPPFCEKCSRPLQEEHRDKPLCQECQKTHPHFDSAWGACLYNGQLRKLIHLFKYGNKVSLRHYFSGLIFSFLSTYHIDTKRYNLLVPIPLHAVRLRERGYNQAQLLSEVLGQKLAITQSSHNLIRVRNTCNQAILRQKERWTNIQGAFRIKHYSQFSKRTILLIDDLMTTGATVSEAARILKEAGAKRVDVLTLAIAQQTR